MKVPLLQIYRLTEWIGHGRIIGLLLFILLAGCKEDDGKVTKGNEPSKVDVSQWISGIENYGMQELVRPEVYEYTWLDAVFLKAMINAYEYTHEAKYYDHILQSVNNTLQKANGGTPNDVAPAAGIAFIYQQTNDEVYKTKADRVWRDYLRIGRSEEGGVSHTYHDIQLWDDTIYMIGLFLQQMYLATDDSTYLEEYIQQLLLHAEKLQDKEIGLWYHGWDEDRENNSLVGGLPTWPDIYTGKSTEFWGRGNGWVIMSLADVLEIIDVSHPQYTQVISLYESMVEALVPWQDPTTSHWFQLPWYPQDADNYIESSCTAMYCYAIAKGIRLGILDHAAYFPVVKKGIEGLATYSTQTLTDVYQQPFNVCVGTSVGDKQYYYSRPTVSGVSFAVGSYLMAGYEMQKVDKK